MEEEDVVADRSSPDREDCVQNLVDLQRFSSDCTTLTSSWCLRCATPPESETSYTSPTVSSVDWVELVRGRTDDEIWRTSAAPCEQTVEHGDNHCHLGAVDATRRAQALPVTVWDDCFSSVRGGCSASWKSENRKQSGKAKGHLQQQLYGENRCRGGCYDKTEVATATSDNCRQQHPDLLGSDQPSQIANRPPHPARHARESRQRSPPNCLPTQSAEPNHHHDWRSQRDVSTSTSWNVVTTDYASRTGYGNDVIQHLATDINRFEASRSVGQMSQPDNGSRDDVVVASKSEREFRVGDRPEMMSSNVTATCDCVSDQSFHTLAACSQHSTEPETRLDNNREPEGNPEVRNRSNREYERHGQTTMANGTPLNSSVKNLITPGILHHQSGSSLVGVPRGPVVPLSAIGERWLRIIERRAAAANESGTRPTHRPTAQMNDVNDDSDAVNTRQLSTSPAVEGTVTRPTEVAAARSNLAVNMNEPMSSSIRARWIDEVNRTRWIDKCCGVFENQPATRSDGATRGDEVNQLADVDETISTSKFRGLRRMWHRMERRHQPGSVNAESKAPNRAKAASGGAVQSSRMLDATSGPTTDGCNDMPFKSSESGDENSANDDQEEVSRISS